MMKINEEKRTVSEYMKFHTVAGIVTETDALWSKGNGKIPKEFLHRTIKEIKVKTLVVF